jgi:hypothetical protein
MVYVTAALPHVNQIEAYTGIDDKNLKSFKIYKQKGLSLAIFSCDLMMDFLHKFCSEIRLEHVLEIPMLLHSLSSSFAQVERGKFIGLGLKEFSDQQPNRITEDSTSCVVGCYSSMVWCLIFSTISFLHALVVKVERYKITRNIRRGTVVHSNKQQH